MKVEEKHMQPCTQEHIYFNGLSRIIPMYHVAILQKSSTYFCKSEIEKKNPSTTLITLLLITWKVLLTLYGYILRGIRPFPKINFNFSQIYFLHKPKQNNILDAHGKFSFSLCKKLCWDLSFTLCPKSTNGKYFNIVVWYILVSSPLNSF